MSLLMLNHMLLASGKYEMPAGSFYTYEEVTSLIKDDGYIPVASGEEFNAIRAVSPTTRHMGIGTPWYGNYTVDVTKKYIQVKNISLAAYQSGLGWEPIPNISSTTPFTGTYVGNNLNITDLVSNYGTTTALFRACKESFLLDRIRVVNASITQYGSYNSILVTGATTTGTGAITNCYVSGTLNGSSNCGAISGINYSNDFGTSGCLIQNCTAEVTMNLIGSTNGGITSTSRGTYAIIDNCEFIGTINHLQTISDETYLGGIVGDNWGNVKYSKFNGNLNSKRVRGVGGIVGLNTSGTVEENITEGTIKAYMSIGGIIGTSSAGTIRNNKNKANLVLDCQVPVFATYPYRNIAGVGRGYSTVAFSNCYSIGSITIENEDGVSNKRLSGCVYAPIETFSGGTANNCYYDSDTVLATVGSGGSYKGTAKTTTQLKADAIGAGIYSTWSGTIWEKEVDGYPTLINNPEA